MKAFKELMNKIEKAYGVSDIHVEIQPVRYTGDNFTHNRLSLEMTCNIEIKTQNKELMKEIQDYIQERIHGGKVNDN